MQVEPDKMGTLCAKAAPTRIADAEIVEDGHHHTYVERENLYNNITILHICV